MTKKKTAGRKRVYSTRGVAAFKIGEVAGSRKVLAAERRKRVNRASHEYWYHVECVACGCTSWKRQDELKNIRHHKSVTCKMCGKGGRLAPAGSAEQEFLVRQNNEMNDIYLDPMSRATKQFVPKNWVPR